MFNDGQEAISLLLREAQGLARAAVMESAEGSVGEHVGVSYEDEVSATHWFAADMPGYRGWQWVVVAVEIPDSARITISEVALIPGPDALLAPAWIPWELRVQPGDLAPGDLLSPLPEDSRLAPGYVSAGDDDVDETAADIGLGRSQVMSYQGRLDAAQRWRDGDFGPRSEMARLAAAHCASCGFYLPLAGSLRVAFGVCGNELSADGHVVHASYGCGAHSDTVLPTGAGSPIFDPYDDGAVEEVVLAESGVEMVATPNLNS
ncbi:MAG: DUF3027 domain-containing protein [Mycobacteriaceae bacterium]